MAKLAFLRLGSVIDGTPPAGSTVSGDVLPDTVAWTAVPTLQNSWANVGGYQTAQYKQDAAGVVHLRGVINTGTKAAGTLLFTLPAGSVPAAKQSWPVASDVAAGVVSTVEILTTGAVNVGPNVALTAACQLTLNGIYFDTV